jgi:hypothetical protein
MMLDFDTVLGNELTMPDLFQSYEAAESMMLRNVGVKLCSYEVCKPPRLSFGQHFLTSLKKTLCDIFIAKP